MPRPMKMLEDVIQCDVLEIIGRKTRIREYATSHLEAACTRVCGRIVVRFKPDRIESETLRQQKKGAIAAADIEQGSTGDAGRRKVTYHVIGERFLLAHDRKHRIPDRPAIGKVISVARVVIAKPQTRLERALIELRYVIGRLEGLVGVIIAISASDRRFGRPWVEISDPAFLAPPHGPVSSGNAECIIPQGAMKQDPTDAVTSRATAEMLKVGCGPFEAG